MRSTILPRLVQVTIVTFAGESCHIMRLNECLHLIAPLHCQSVPTNFEFKYQSAAGSLHSVKSQTCMKVQSPPPGGAASSAPAFGFALFFRCFLPRCGWLPSSCSRDVHASLHVRGSPTTSP